MLVKTELQGGHFQSAKGGQLQRLLHLVVKCRNTLPVIWEKECPENINNR